MATIFTWKQFIRERKSRKKPLLSKISEMNDLIFVTGCQRSGTTMVTNIIRQSSEVTPYQTDLDSELEGALILGGYSELNTAPQTKQCFQTTYLNADYHEYFEHLDRFKLIFVIRNPLSVVYSMIHNWTRRREFRNYPLNDLFLSCGKTGLLPSERIWFKVFGSIGFSRLRKACLSYNAKIMQIFYLEPVLKEKIMIVDYDVLVKNKEIVIPRLFDFADIPYNIAFVDLIKNKSLKKWHNFSHRKQKIINDTCQNTYEKAAKLALTMNRTDISKSH